MRYSTAFEIGDYRPSDVKVKINGNQLVFKEKSAGETLIKVITLPEFVNPHTVELYLNDGSLFIEAPVMFDRLRMNYLNNVSSSSNETSSSSTTNTSNTITENSQRDDFYNMASALLKGFESKPALEDAPTSFAITETRINQNQPSAEITYKFNVKAESQQEDDSCCLVRRPCPPPCLPYIPCSPPPTPPVLCLPAPPPLPVCPPKPTMPCCTCNRTTTMALVPLGLSKSTFSIKEIQFDNLYENSRCSSSNSSSNTMTAATTATTATATTTGTATTSTTCNTPVSYMSRVNRTITSYSTAPTITTTRNSFSEASTSFTTPPPPPPSVPIAYATRNSFVEQSKSIKSSSSTTKTTTTGASAGAAAQTSTIINTTTVKTQPPSQPQPQPQSPSPITKVSDITYKFKLKEFRSQDIQVTFTENLKMKIHAIRQTPDARGFGNNFCN